MNKDNSNPVYRVVEHAEDNPRFQEGRKAAENGEKRDELKGLDWILGYGSVKKEKP